MRQKNCGLTKRKVELIKGQTYFRVNPEGTTFEVEVPPRVITKLEQSEIISINFLDRVSALDLDGKELSLLSSGELIYDGVIRNWLHSKFGPPSYFEFIWKKIIENGQGRMTRKRTLKIHLTF